MVVAIANVQIIKRMGAGTSIGVINASIMAGSKQEDHPEKALAILVR